MSDRMNTPDKPKIHAELNRLIEKHGWPYVVNEILCVLDMIAFEEEDDELQQCVKDIDALLTEYQRQVSERL